MNFANDSKPATQVKVDSNVKIKDLNDLEQNKVLRAYSLALRTLQHSNGKNKISFLPNARAGKSKNLTDAQVTLSSLKEESKSEKKIKNRAKTPLKTGSLGKVRRMAVAIKDSQGVRFEILKARSDLLEIKRDLATYEFEAIEGVEIGLKKKVLDEEFSRLKENFGEFNMETCGIEIGKNIEKLLGNQKGFGGDRKGNEVFCEAFGVRICDKGNLELFQGFFNFSGLIMLVSVQSLSISRHILTYTHQGKSSKLSIDQPLLDLHPIKLSILRHCFAVILQDKLHLKYDPLHSVHFLVVSARITNLGQVSIKLEPKTLGINVEVLVYNLNLFIPSTDLCPSFKELTNLQALLSESAIIPSPKLSSISKELNENLVYLKKKLIIMQKSSIFASKEENSYLLKDERLSQIFSNYLKQKDKFIVRVNGKQVKVSILDTTLKISLKNKSTAYLELEHISFLENLQNLAIIKSPLTLSKSLELKLLIIKLLKL